MPCVQSQIERLNIGVLNWRDAFSLPKVSVIQSYSKLKQVLFYLETKL